MYTNNNINKTTQSVTGMFAHKHRQKLQANKSLINVTRITERIIRTIPSCTVYLTTLTMISTVNKYLTIFFLHWRQITTHSLLLRHVIHKDKSFLRWEIRRLLHMQHKCKPLVT